MRSPLGALMSGIAARSPVPLAPRVSGAINMFGNTRRLNDQLLATTSEVGTVFMVVNRLTTAVSKVDWHLYRSSASGKKEDRVEVTKHAALDLWNKPNPFMSRRKFMELSQQHLELVGENAMVVSKVGRLPLELWPVRPDRIMPVPDPFEFLAGYVYTSPGGEQVPLATDEVLRNLMPNPADMYRGLGPVQAILTDIDSVKYSAEWNRAFFENSAAPGGVVQFPNSVSDPDFERFTARWRESHQGVANAHRVAILEAGATWTDRQFSQKDMQFAELRTAGRDTIMEAWGFPKPIGGITEDVNRANAEAAEYLFAKWLVEERLDRWRDLLNFELLPMYGPTGAGLEWDYDSPVESNTENDIQLLTARWTAMGIAVPLGFDPAEMLESLDLPAVKFEKPAPPPAPVIAPPGSPPPGQESDDPAPDDPAPTAAFDRMFDAWLERKAARFDAANRWVSKAHLDDSTCQPCRDNDGKLYKNRESAYEDYPGGKGYVDCIGAEYGNECRCTVSKRKGE